MHDLFSLGMFQLGGRGLRVKGRKTADGAFAFHGTTRSADVSPSPTSHNTIKVTVDLRVTGSSGARGFQCIYPSPAQLSSARSVSEAEAILHRAGIFAAYGGAPPGIADFRRAGLACTGRPAERHRRCRSSMTHSRPGESPASPLTDSNR
jgi:hypothetical protein